MKMKSDRGWSRWTPAERQKQVEDDGADIISIKADRKGLGCLTYDPIPKPVHVWIPCISFWVQKKHQAVRHRPLGVRSIPASTPPASTAFPRANVLLVKPASTPVPSTPKPSSISWQIHVPQRVAHQARILVRRVYNLCVVVNIWAAVRELVVSWAQIGSYSVWLVRRGGHISTKPQYG